MSPEKASDAAVVRRQGFWLFLGTVVNSGLGFVFWFIAYGLFDDATTGTAAALISLSSLGTSIATLGLDNGLVRYISKVDRPRRLLAQTAAVNGAVGGLVGLVLMAVIFTASQQFNPAALPYLFLVGATLTVSDTWFQLTDSALNAAGRTEILAARSVAFGAGKILLLYAVASLGVLGLLSAYTLPMLAVVLLGFLFSVYVWPSRNPAGTPHPIREFASLSLGNYFSGMIWFLPQRVAPALILLFIGAADVSYFFLALMLAEVVNYIPESVSKVVFAHGSRRDELSPTLMRTVRLWLIVIVVPLVLVGVALSAFGLAFVGHRPEYAAHALALQLFLLAVIPRMGLQMLKAQFNVERRIRALLLLGVVTGVSTLVLFVGELALRVPVDALPSAWVAGSTIGLVVCARVAGWRFAGPRRAPG